MKASAKVFGSFATVKLVLLVIELLLMTWFIAALPFVNAGTIAGVFICLLLIFLTLKCKAFKSFVKKTCTTAAGKGVSPRLPLRSGLNA
jgi:hypothetical protein